MFLLISQFLKNHLGVNCAVGEARKVVGWPFDAQRICLVVEL